MLKCKIRVRMRQEKVNRNKLLNKIEFILCFIPFALPLQFIYYNVI